MAEEYTVGRVAEIAGVTVRTLHHYDEIGLVGTDKVGGEWAEEAEARWGGTDAYRESQRRTASYSKDDWARLKEESDAGLREFATVMADGVPPDSDAARALAEEHRQYLSRWFYDCGFEMHRNLADMYIADERFTATFDTVAPGLAAYVREAIVANATAHGA